MPTIAEVRAKFPQYSDMSDGDLADALHKKFYADLPKDQFDKQIGLGGPTPSEQTAGDYATTLAKNIPASAGRFVTDTVQPIIHPIETAENIGSIGKGVLQKFGIVSGNDSEKYADAVGQFFKDRYGGWENVAKTLRDDPVGALADLSVVLTGGGSAAARTGGAVGKLGEIAATAGKVVDPLNAAIIPAKVAGKAGAEVLGLTTGAGSEAIKTAARAGAEGGDAATAFREGISGAADATSTVAEAKGAVRQLREDRGIAYREAMDKLRQADAGISPLDRVLDFGKIDTAIDKVSGVKNFKGQDLSPATKEVRGEIKTAVDDWRKLPPADFHTIEGFDALKQKIGDIRDGTLPNTPARTIANQTYDAVRQTIVDYDKNYAKIMKGYEAASSIIREIESTLSLKPGANVDTSLRKLQSVLRNNVNTNYGRRAELVDFLTRAGAPNLMEKLAGQTLSSVSPRGIGRVVTGGEGIGALTALAAGHPGAAATLGAGVLASSPRLVGNVAYGLGKASRYGRPATQGAFQLGRTNRALQ